MNKRVMLIACLIGFLTIGLASLGAQEAEENETKPLYTSATGLRLEQNGNGFSVTFSTGQRAKLPVELADPQEAGNFPDEFHASPNQEWIFAPHHVDSCLRDGELFHRTGPVKVDRAGDFNARMWKNAFKLGEFARDFAGEDVCHMVDFECWSGDSGRLLLLLRGREDKREMKDHHICFSTRTQKFELTDYLRKLNRSKGEMLACAEPIAPLPSESELKAKCEALDRQLNARYAEVIAKAPQDRVSASAVAPGRADVYRAWQRDWLKRRDEGAKFYVSLFPPAEKERRRLQFLCDVTFARIDTPNEQLVL
ncbi:MAG TPA: lysozyme inhibitor LprI family protein [Candidatus Udaeobacter sp.]